MIGQRLTVLKGGDKRALLFPFDSIPGPSPDQYCLAVQAVSNGLIFNSVCRTIDPKQGVTEASVLKDYDAMVAANGGPEPAPNSLGELPGKPTPPPPTDPPAPERTAPPRRTR